MDSSFDQFEVEQQNPQIKLKSKSSNFFSCLLDCLSSCCLAVNCCLAGGFGCGDDDDDENDPNHSKRKRKSCLKNKRAPAGGNSRPNLYRGSSVEGVFNSSTDEFNLDELEFSSEELRNPSRSTTRTPLGVNSRTELYVICSRCSRYSQVSDNSKSCAKNHEDDNEQDENDDDEDEDEDEDEVFRLEKPRSLSTPGYSPGYSGISQTSKGSKATKKSTGDVPNGEICVSRLAIISPTGFSDGFHSKPTSPTSQTSGDSLHRSPSNYCRVATCEQLHIHDLTPKCLETFAPSSTCSSCQTCDRPHIGPNHDQVLLVSKLLKHLQLPPSAAATPTSLTIPELKPTGPNMKHQNTSSYLMQWPLPEYRPQRSPDHLYRSFGF